MASTAAINFQRGSGLSVAKTSFDPDEKLRNGALRFPCCAVRVAAQAKPPQMVRKQ